MPKLEPFKLAFVTGASSGIGEALCRHLAKQHIPLIITGRKFDALQKLAEELRSQVPVEVIAADLNSVEARSKLIDKIHELSPDLIINNAGFGYYGEALSYKTQEQLDIVRVNCEALLELTLEGARTLISREKKGVIMNIASAAAFQPMPLFSVYAASKGFVKQVSEALDHEMRPHGIRILTSCPGQVATRFRNRASKGTRENRKDAQTMDVDFAIDEIWKQITQKQPVHVFNWHYRLMTFLSNHIPRKWLFKIMDKQINERTAPRPLIKI